MHLCMYIYIERERDGRVSSLSAYILESTQDVVEGGGEIVAM